MNTKKILDEFKKQLTQLYGKRLSAIIPYGSQAKGDFDQNADVEKLARLLKDGTPKRKS